MRTSFVRRGRMGNAREKLLQAAVDAWHFEHRFNEKFGRKDDFKKAAPAELRSEVDWLLETTKQLRSKPSAYDSDPAELSRRAKDALAKIEKIPPSERASASGGWGPSKPKFPTKTLLALTFLASFSYCAYQAGAFSDPQGKRPASSRVKVRDPRP